MWQNWNVVPICLCTSNHKKECFKVQNLLFKDSFLLCETITWVLQCVMGCLGLGGTTCNRLQNWFREKNPWRHSVLKQSVVYSSPPLRCSTFLLFGATRHMVSVQNASIKFMQPIFSRIKFIQFKPDAFCHPQISVILPLNAAHICTHTHNINMVSPAVTATLFLL